MKSIKAKLSISISILVIIGIVACIFVATTIAGDKMRDMDKQCLQVQAYRYGSEINGWVIEEKLVTEDTAASIELLGKIDETEIKKIITSNFKDRPELLDMYFGTEDGEFWKASTASEVPAGYDPRERGWYKSAKAAGGTIVTDPYFDAFTLQMCDTIAVPVYFNGKFVGVLGIDMTIDTVTEKAAGVDYDDGVYAFVTDGSGNFIYHPNEDYMPAEDEAVSATEMIADAKSILENPSDENIVESKDYKGKSVYIATAPIESANWTIGIAIPKANADKIVSKMAGTIMGVGVVAVVIVIVFLIIQVSLILNPVNKMKEAAVKLAKGDLTVKLDKAKGADEVSVLQNAIYDLMQSITPMISEANTVLGEIADGNLAVNDMSSYPGDFNKLSESVNQIRKTLGRLILMVKQAAGEVNNGSNHLAMAADSLANATTTEAMAIQSLKSNVESITSMINKSSDNCMEVNGKLAELNDEIRNGNNAMAELYEAVSQVETMSNDIQKIVNAIDNIAFQTNILALNASVEAARAGEAGKGFAVVADEVRNLASKSAEEANKTAELIENCLKAVTRAKGFADNTTECLNEVVDHSGVIANAFEDIANLAGEEAISANGISVEIEKVSDTVQSNSATAEETAAASAELTREAENLIKMVSNFKTN